MKEEKKCTARDTALEVLMQVEKANAWSDGSLKRTIAKNGLEGREAALATRLSYGVIQNRTLLDYYISCYCVQKAHKLEPVIRNRRVSDLIYGQDPPPRCRERGGGDVPTERTTPRGGHGQRRAA